MYSIEQALEYGIISEELVEEMPSKCKCGSELQITGTKVPQLFCPNAYCKYKVADRMETMAKSLSADGWGNRSCLAVIEDFNLFSPYQLFLLEKYQDSYDGVAGFKSKINRLMESPARRCRLWECVQYGNIPHIDTIAQKIFDGYDSIESAYVDIEREELPLIVEKLGLRGDSIILATRIYNTLIEYKDELIFGQGFFDIRKTADTQVKIAITNGVYGFKNKSEFDRYLANRYDGKLNIIRLKNVTKDISYLVYDGGDTHGKYNTAMELQSAGNPIKIVSSDELINELDTLQGGLVII